MGLIMVNKERLLDDFLEFTAIEGVSRNEAEVINDVKRRLDKLGIRYTVDNAGEKFGGNSGNLIAYFPGTVPGKTFCLSAHVDTISSSAGKPYEKDGVIYSDGKTVLGADDRAGAAAMLEAVQCVIEQGVDHPDIELLFLVGEEIGLFGSKYLDYGKLKSTYGFVLDSSADPGKIVSHAPTHMSCGITVRGKAAHAAIAPELGVHAIKIAAEGIYNTKVGRITDDSTVSIGVINGGTKTNVVPDLVEIAAEVRGLNKEEVPGHKATLENNFKAAAEKYGGEVSFDWNTEYNGFKLGEDSGIISLTKKAMKSAGLEPELIKFVGGSDANNFNENGITSVNLGFGYKKNHSNEEYMKVDFLNSMTEVIFEVIRLSGSAK